MKYNLYYNHYAINMRITLFSTILREKAMATHSSTLAWKNPMDGGAW